jgi:glycosyltransferase involved in cell wall biosynthesis
MNTPAARIDLHVHSKFSKRPSQWILQKIGCPESFTDPLELYRIAADRGMTLFTVTDHNRIDGALAIAHLPGTFISEEITSYFPDDRCKVHVLAYDITEPQHREIQKVRENLYELVDYLVDADILHVIAHPLYSVNDRLTVAHFQKLLLLFKCFELNGARNDDTNSCLETILKNLTHADIERLADIHGIAPKMPQPWVKILTGGSDDHSALNIARTHTVIPGADTPPAALKAIAAGSARVERMPSTPLTFAHNLYGIAYQFYKSRFNLQGYTGKDVLLNFLDRSLQPKAVASKPGLIAKLYFLWHYRKQPKYDPGATQSLADLVRSESGKLLRDNPDLMRIAGDAPDSRHDIERNWFKFVNHVSNRILLGFANHLIDHFSGADVFNIFQTIGAAGGLSAILAPYFISFSYFAQDRSFNATVLQHWGGTTPSAGGGAQGPIAVAHMVDSFADPAAVQARLNGIRRFLIDADREDSVFTCNNDLDFPGNGIRVFEPIGTYVHPESGEKILFPPLMEILHDSYVRRITHLHSVTPGPMGLAAVAVGRILKLPVFGTYHTAIDRYAPFLKGDESVEIVIERFMSWYYDQLDQIYVFSRADENALLDRGVNPRKIRFVPPAVDIERFHPGNRNGYLERRFGISATVKIACCGTLTRENNMDLLAEVFKILSSALDGIHLIIAGSGEFGPQMKRLLSGTPATFVGDCPAETMAKIYASSDMFVLPGADQKGAREALRAQASGIPVVVADCRQFRQAMIPGQTGQVFRPDDAAGLYEAMHGLCTDSMRRRMLGISARRHAESLANSTAAFRASLASLPFETDCETNLAAQAL